MISDQVLELKAVAEKRWLFTLYFARWQKL